MSYYSELSPQERLKKVSELLLRGMYLHAKEKGWIKKLPVSVRKSKKRKTSEIMTLPIETTNVSVKDLYTVAETAKILRITTRTLQRWIRIGKIETVRKVNGYHVISKDEINYLIAIKL